MAYADFTFYSTQYLGDVITESAFPQLALRASAVIDQITFARAAAIVTAATDTTTITKIKMAMCALAEELQRQDSNSGADGITSESVGSHSVTYGTNSNRAQSNQSKLENAARLWLDGTYLMFAGFNSGEYGGIVNDP